MSDELQARNNGSRFVLKRYVLRHWRGEFSFGTSIRVSSLPVLFLYFGIILIDYGTRATVNMAFYLGIILIPRVLFLVFSIWQIVGLWRCLAKESAKVARVVATRLRSCLVVWALLLLLKGADFTRQFSKTALVLARIPACQMISMPGGKELWIHGGLGPGSASSLAAAIKALPDLKVIHVDSSGGLIAEGLMMGKLVREHKFNTFTDGCASAATLVFIQGAQRTVREGAKLGFHAPIALGFSSANLSSAHSYVKTAMQQAGISSNFVDRTFATQPPQIWYPSTVELKRAGVATASDGTFVTFTANLRSFMANRSNNLTLTPLLSGRVEIDRLTEDLGQFLREWNDFFITTTSAPINPALYDFATRSGDITQDAIYGWQRDQIERVRVLTDDRLKAKLMLMRSKQQLTERDKFSFDESVLSGIGFRYLEKLWRQSDEVFAAKLALEKEDERLLQFMVEKGSHLTSKDRAIGLDNPGDKAEFDKRNRALAQARQLAAQAVEKAMEIPPTGLELP